MKNTTTSRKRSNTVGVWAFTLGVVIAVVLGFASMFFDLSTQTQQWLAVVLAVIGVIVGILNVTGDEAMSFLTVTAILVIVSYAGGQSLAVLGDRIQSFFNALLTLFVPATIVVAIRALWVLARD